MSSSCNDAALFLVFFFKGWGGGGSRKYKIKEVFLITARCLLTNKQILKVIDRGFLCKILKLPYEMLYSCSEFAKACSIRTLIHTNK